MRVGRRLVQVAVGKSAVVSDSGDEPGTLTGAIELERNGLLYTCGHRRPQSGPALVHLAQIVCLPAAVAAGEDGVVGVAWVYFHVEEPVDAGVDDVRGLGLVVFPSLSEYGLPSLAPINGAEDFLAGVHSGHRPSEGTGNQMLGILRVHADANVGEGPVPGWLVRGDLGPLVFRYVIFPQASVTHRLRSGIGAVGDVQATVGGDGGVVGHILERGSLHRFPRSAAVAGDEHVGAVHLRVAHEDGLRAVSGLSALRVEDHENHPAAYALAYLH